MEKILGKRIFTMHDPLAVAVALDPTLVETRRAAVDVETTGRLTTGATIVDWRGQWGRLANSEVAVAVEAERFRGLSRRDGAPGRGRGGEKDVRGSPSRDWRETRGLYGSSRAKPWRLSSCRPSFYLCSSDYSRKARGAAP